MTLPLLTHLNKHNLYNLIVSLDYAKITLPLIVPFFGTGTDSESNRLITCKCCGWKGTELKAHKHYLEVAGIAELELYCPKCRQYLCFISEPA